MIQTISYPRAAVIGNPSDGYHGKTIAFVFNNYKAKAEITKHNRIEISDDQGNSIAFNDCEDLVAYIDHNGFNQPSTDKLKLALGSIYHLYKVGLKSSNKSIEPKFKIHYSSSIPRSVGLAGSSAIITAIVKAIYLFNKIPVNKHRLPNTILNIEAKELGITAGLQDRVAQVFEEPVFMNFEKSFMDQNGHGEYEPLVGLEKLNWYIAYPKEMAESSEITHSTLRSRYDSGDSKMRQAMALFSDYSDRFRIAISSKNVELINQLINANFDLRKSIMPIKSEFVNIIDLARSTGASAKFTGSGGAIIGLYTDDKQFAQLQQLFNKNHIQLLKPKIVRNA